MLRGMSAPAPDSLELPRFSSFVAGEARRTGNLRVLVSPFDGRKLAVVEEAGPDELEAALAAAAGATAAARALSSEQRAEICTAVARGVIARRDELALAICDEAGKPITDATAEVERAALCFELAAAEAQRAAREGEVLPMDLRAAGRGRMGITQRVPIGPVAAISPFNFPLNLAVHKIAPALAAGCPVVLKPATQAPTATLRLAEIIAATAWPKGALRVLPAARAAADVLVTDPRCKLLSFTGSGAVGWDMKARAGHKRVVLELGGNAAVIIDETVTAADLDAIIPKLIYGAFSYAGQKCISVQRIYIVDRDHGRLHAEFTERFIAATRALQVGDPRDPKVMVGPMIDEANARRVEEWVREAAALGARVLCGGERRGAVVSPTVLAEVPGQARAACDEIFGPVCNLERVPSFDAALQAVNDSRYGLQAAVFTRDLGHSLRAFDELEVGAVILNEAPSFRIDHMPYGGVKESGLGREGISSAIEDMTELRLLVTGTLPPLA